MRNSDEIYKLDQGTWEALSARSMRDGLMGKNLEDALQTLLEDNPNLIPGKQIAPSVEPAPQFILLRREIAISGWSLDHLFVDQYGVPTLVEAKLIQNPEARREVIGQIIEYAANAADLWSEGRARSYAEDYYHEKNLDLNLALKSSYGDELDVDNFWQTFEENLREGKIRMIIAADQIRPEIRRMIEFLNSEMQNAEIFGLEIACYGNSEHSLVIVPRIIGQTQASADRKSDPRKATKWLPTLIESTLESMDKTLRNARLLKVLQWSVQNGTFIPAQSQNPSFNVGNRHKKRLISFNIDGGGYICLAEFYFNDDKNDRSKFFSGIKEIGLIGSNEDIEEIKDGRYYSRNLDQLTDDEFDHLIRLMDSLN